MAVKQLLVANLSPDGDLNNDCFLRTILQMRNTLDSDCGISSAEVVFGHSMQDAFFCE